MNIKLFIYLNNFLFLEFMFLYLLAILNKTLINILVNTSLKTIVFLEYISISIITRLKVMHIFKRLLIYISRLASTKVVPIYILTNRV